jgi:hypothetical protein
MTSSIPSPEKETSASVGMLNATAYYTRGNAPRRWQDYLAYPRVLFTFILCIVTVVLHVAFGIYVWFFW